jgi:hypothetical protein
VAAVGEYGEDTAATPDRVPAGVPAASYQDERSREMTHDRDRKARMSPRVRPLLLALLAAAALVGGAAYASIPDETGVIHACFAPRQGGAVRVIDTALNEQCKPTEKPLDWNRVGPKGPPGPAGESGAPGPSDAFVMRQAVGAPVTVGGGVGNSVLPGPFQLPPGSYVLNAKAVARNQAELPTTFHCSITDDLFSKQRTVYDSSSATLPGANNDLLDSGWVTIAMQVTIDHGGTFFVDCSVRGMNFSATVTDAVLTAIKVGTLTTQ